MAIGVEPNSGRGVSNLPAAATVPVNNSEAYSTLVTTVLRAYITGIDTNGAINGSVGSMLAPTADGQTWNAGTIRALLVAAGLYAFNGASFDRLRTPSTVKTATATAAGTTALWTPTTGKKFRLMGLLVELTADATLAAAATFHITLQDAAAAMNLGWSARVGTTGATTTTTANIIEAGWSDFGNGFPSAAANNVLNLNLSAALTAGVVRATAFGTEE